jgi:hypothetical protein
MNPSCSINSDLNQMLNNFNNNDWFRYYLIICNQRRGDLSCRHGEAAFDLLSLAKYTGVSRKTLAEPPYYLWALDLFTPEDITVKKYEFKHYFSGCPNQQIGWPFLLNGLIIGTCSHFVDSATLKTQRVAYQAVVRTTGSYTSTSL